MGPFDVTPEDIQKLDDGQLRNALRLLIESEANQHRIPLSAIHLGGNQNAKDGGVDARVEWVDQSERTNWFPKRLTIFQSKAEDMPPSDLRDELAPNGSPRPIFEELANKDGAYIVFSTNNCTNSMHNGRIAAMRDAIATVPHSNAVVLDFYDASRIARWANTYPGVANELLRFVGRPMAGWRPFENWSAPQLTTPDEYLLDDKPRVTFGRDGEPESISDTINKLRAQMQSSVCAIRLIGMSGVGKTRFVQALFDTQVGDHALNPGLAVYGDLSLSLGAPPSQVAEELVLARQDAVMIVDNCPGDTHRALAKITQRPDSHVRLLTIDHDIRHDQPENTLVILMSENGDQLIDTLLQMRVPKLSSSDRSRVAEFSGGNARIALTIAAQAAGSGSLGQLSDRELVDRLFLDDRQQMNETQKRCAEVAALVYAFHVETENDQEPEHPILAELAETSPGEMYRAVAEFVDRGIAQKRGTQRAMLPQALAMRLATRALERLPPDVILSHFDREGRARLFQSFTRRLGFLHQSEAARKIANRLLGDDGNLSDLTTLDTYRSTLVENLAPVVPEAVLSAIERAVVGSEGKAFLSPENSQRWRFATLARNLAYNAEFFERAANVLLAFAKEEPEDSKRNSNSIRRKFLELFWIVGSWTQAPPQQRYEFIDRMLKSDVDFDRRIAIDALEHALDTNSRVSTHHGEFGSRPMGREWRHHTIADQDDWFRGALTRLVSIACQDDDLAQLARSAISQEIRGLIRIGLVDDVSTALGAIHAKGFWPDGWRSLCAAMHFDQKKWPPETHAKANQIEITLRPIDIEERFSTFVLAEPWGLYTIDSELGRDEVDTVTLAEKIGEEASKLEGVRPSLIRQACAFKGQSNSYAFGRGLAKGTSDPRELWILLVQIFCEQESVHQNPTVLAGFLNGAAERAPNEVQGWLDEAVLDDALGPHIVALSIHLPVDRNSIIRLTRAIQLGKASLNTFYNLIAGRAVHPTPPDALARFLRTLMGVGVTGEVIAAEILHMRFWGRNEKEPVDADLLDVGRALLRSASLYRDISSNRAYGLAHIAEECLVQHGGAELARDICCVLLHLAKTDYSSAFEVERLIRRSAKLHPRVVLETILENDETTDLLAERLFGDTDGDEPNNGYQSSINDEVLIAWIKEDPDPRAIRAARVIRYCQEDGKGSISWTPIAEHLMCLPNIGLEVSEGFYSRFHVGSGWGPWSNIVARRRPLLVALTFHADPSIRSWANETLPQFDDEVARLVKRERARDERFE
jgi:hypothetical protein